MDSDDEHRQGSSDEEEHRGDDEPGVRVLPAIRRIALQDFFREIRTRATAHTNEELVEHLREGDTLRTDAVRRAFLACPRALFVPEGYQDEAYVDAPIRVEELGFNISAPHMHATGISALDLQPGDRFLDIGSGCGAVSALAAYLVGTKGEVVGIDTRQECVDMCKRNCERLRQQNPEWSEVSAPLTFFTHNVFIPSSQLMGRFTKIHVGAMCPSSRMKEILKLLTPEGGAIIAPVDSELRRVCKDASGSVKSHIVSQVRFTELEVPRDVDIVLSVLQDETQAARSVSVPSSSYESDLVRAGVEPSRAKKAAAAAASANQHICGEPTHGLPSSGAGAEGRLSDGQTCSGAAAAPAGDASETNGAKRHKTGEQWAPAAAATNQQQSHLTRYLTFAQNCLGLGPPDCELVGDEATLAGGGMDGCGGEAKESAMEVSGASDNGLQQQGQQQQQEGQQAWRLPAHRALLGARSEHFRARFDSGMRDASVPSFPAPEGVSAPSIAALLQYIYTDRGVDEVALELMGELLHVSCYYGCPHLTSLCEARLVSMLLAPPPAITAGTAGATQDDPENGGDVEGGVTASSVPQPSGAAAGNRGGASVSGGGADGSVGGGGGGDGGGGEGGNEGSSSTTPLLQQQQQQQGEKEGEHKSRGSNAGGSGARDSEGKAAGKASKGLSPSEAKREKKMRQDKQIAQEREQRQAQEAARAAALAQTDDLAAQLLLLADEARLNKLKEVCLSYIGERFDGVRASESWGALPRHLVDEVASHCCAQSMRVLKMLKELSLEAQEEEDE